MSPQFLRTGILTVSFACLSTLLSSVTADDWPQWMGPGRDNVWRESGILTKFPAGGPRVLWRTPVAGGYAGPAVADGRVFVTDYITSDNVKVDNFERAEFTGQERVQCLKESSGEVLWTHAWPVKYSISYPAGPRCTPTVDGDRVYILGAEGNLFCFSATDGTIRWSKDLKLEYRTKTALWGYAAHPLVDGDRLLTLAGGEGSHMVALDKLTGREIWRSGTAPEQGYCPPTILHSGGVRQLVSLRPDAVVSMNPDNGEVYWSVPYQASNGSIIMSPVTSGDYLYAAGYSNKSLMLKLNAKSPGAEEVWRDKSNVICPVNVQPFVVDDVIYGFDQKGVLRALRVPSGERLWETSDVIGKRPAGSETAFLIRHEDHFWLFNELGQLVIAKLTPEGYTEVDRATVIAQTNTAFGRDVVWSMPAFANRHAYIRNDNEIICVDLAE
ncbi:MAG: PQQ-binding-like beta-propeller repeat protein [Planctomycetaceae bacterium]|nr:PQQ-binding-like beta-propeller repeat protein [Planctomycetaceae bacterium]